MATPNDGMPAPSQLVEDVLGLLEDRKVPTKFNDQVVMVLESYEKQKPEWRETRDNNLIGPQNEYELELQRLILDNSNLVVDEFYFERTDNDQCPERYVYIYGRNTWARLEITIEWKTAKSTYKTEWMCRSEDGKFVSLEHKKLLDAIKHLEFIIGVLADINKSVAEVI